MTWEAAMRDCADEMDRRWMLVGKAWQDGHRKCDQCSYAKFDQQAHPYGEGVAYEDISECTLGQYASHKPEMCPALASLLESDTERMKVTLVRIAHEDPGGTFGTIATQVLDSLGRSA